MMDATITQTPSGGLRVMIHDEETDSLVTLRVSRSHGRILAATGLRGNWDADARPFRDHSMSIEAPEVSKEERKRRKESWLRRNVWRISA